MTDWGHSRTQQGAKSRGPFQQLLEFSLPELIPDALLILNEDVRPAQDVPGLLCRRLANVGGEPLKAHDREDHLAWVDVEIRKSLERGRNLCKG